MYLCKTELLKRELFWRLNCVLMLSWIVWNKTVYCNKMDLALNNLQWLICLKTKPNKTETKPTIIWFQVFLSNSNKTILKTRVQSISTILDGDGVILRSEECRVSVYCLNFLVHSVPECPVYGSNTFVW